MSCDKWQEAIVGRLYGEIDPAEDRALESHLATCVACRVALEGLGRLRVVLRDNEPEVERPPRVVVSATRPGSAPPCSRRPSSARRCSRASAPEPATRWGGKARLPRHR